MNIAENRITAISVFFKRWFVCRWTLFVPRLWPWRGVGGHFGGRLHEPSDTPSSINSQSHLAWGAVHTLSEPSWVSQGTSFSFVYSVLLMEACKFLCMCLLLKVLTISGKKLSKENKINMNLLLSLLLFPPAYPTFTSVHFLSGRYISCLEHVLSMLILGPQCGVAHEPLFSCLEQGSWIWELRGSP